MIRPSFIKGLNGEKMAIKDWIEEVVIYDRVSSFVRRVARFIKRMWKWIPMLWNQEEWDYA